MALVIATAVPANPSQIASADASTPTIDADGTVHITALAVPLSAHMSEKAKQAFVGIFPHGGTPAAEPGRAENPSPDELRLAARCPGEGDSLIKADAHRRLIIDRDKAEYPVTIERRIMAGVNVDVVIPKDGVSSRNRNRVLINVHGGGYNCASSGGLDGQVEAIPVAGSGQIKVIAVDYRTSPSIASRLETKISRLYIVSYSGPTGQRTLASTGARPAPLCRQDRSSGFKVTSCRDRVPSDYSVTAQPKMIMSMATDGSSIWH